MSITNPWPRFTKEGFKKERIPDDLYFDMMLEYNKARFTDIQQDPYFEPHYDQVVSGGAIAMLDTDEPFYLRANISDQAFDRWAKKLQPLMEKWCGEKLNFIQGYGIRSYHKDSMLCVHRDEISTHIISLIVHVDEHPEVKRPLEFIDHDGKLHKVTFDKGDMLMYESLCVHARETPFTGEYYRNMYFHWCPVDWDPTPYQNNWVRYRSIQEALNED